MESAQPRPLETAGGFVVAGFATDLRASTQQCATGAASTQSCRGRKESRLWLVSVREKTWKTHGVQRKPLNTLWLCQNSY